MPLELAKFEFTFRAAEPIVLPPYTGSALRGGFSHTFKKTVCVEHDGNCRKCSLRTDCVYSYIFETPLTRKIALIPKNTEAPHPFVIEPSEGKNRILQEGEEFKINLTLIGKAMDYLPYFIHTFEQLGNTGISKGRGKFSLHTITDKGDNQGANIYDRTTQTVTGNYRVLRFQDFVEKAEKIGEVTEVKLLFLTPTRIKYQGKLAADVEFHVVMRNLLRRMTNLAIIHCNEALGLDYAALIKRAEKITTASSDLKWYDWERYQDKLGGVLGEAAFTGRLHQFLPFLFLGEFIHLGKGTSFGLGRYEVEVIKGK